MDDQAKTCHLLVLLECVSDLSDQSDGATVRSHNQIFVRSVRDGCYVNGFAFSLRHSWRALGMLGMSPALSCKGSGGLDRGAARGPPPPCCVLPTIARNRSHLQNIW